VITEGGRIDYFKNTAANMDKFCCTILYNIDSFSVLSAKTDLLSEKKASLLFKILATGADSQIRLQAENSSREGLAN
jgi:hypothetical protein